VEILEHIIAQKYSLQKSKLYWAPEIKEWKVKEREREILETVNTLICKCECYKK